MKDIVDWFDNIDVIDWVVSVKMRFDVCIYSIDDDYVVLYIFIVEEFVGCKYLEECK